MATKCQRLYILKKKQIFLVRSGSGNIRVSRGFILIVQSRIVKEQER